MPRRPSLLLPALLAACAAPATTPSAISVSIAPPPAHAAAPSVTVDSLCASLMKETADARTRAEAEWSEGATSPAALKARHDELQMNLGDALRELDRWTRVRTKAEADLAANPKNVNAANRLQMANAMQQDQRSRVQSAQNELAAPSPSAPPPEVDLPYPPYLGKCTKVSNGVWSAVLEQLHFEDPNREHDTDQARWAIVFAGVNGERARYEPEVPLPDDAPPDPSKPPQFNLSAGQVAHVTSAGPVAFDYDGDGREELVASLSYLYHSMLDDRRGTWGRVLTVRDGKIVPYAPASAIEVFDVRDENGDGRPDLFSMSQTETPADDDCQNECVSSYSDDISAPWLSRPDGTFVQSNKANKANKANE